MLGDTCTVCGIINPLKYKRTSAVPTTDICVPLADRNRKRSLKFRGVIFMFKLRAVLSLIIDTAAPESTSASIVRLPNFNVT